MAEQITRMCDYCGVTLASRTSAHWSGRTHFYCSRAHANLGQGGPRVERAKFCAVCGAPCPHRKPSYLVRIKVPYCSRPCADQGLRTEPAIRFAALVPIGPIEECWNYQGTIAPDGYGRFWDGQRTINAHRFAYEQAHGEGSADGWQVNHGCVGNRACCNPAHLYLGDRRGRDNADDCVAQGRSATGARNGNSTHPERIARGDQHWMRRYPERIVRGDQHYRRQRPELIPRGERVGNAKFTDAEVAELKAALRAGARVRDLARQQGVTDATISKIKLGRTWQHIP